MVVATFLTAQQIQITGTPGSPSANGRTFITIGTLACAIAITLFTDITL
jgi:hypothetical protein